MSIFNNKLGAGLITLGVAVALVFGVSTTFATPASFSIDSITANCDGTGQVFFTGTIPQNGFTLELMDKAPDNSGSFIPTVPPTIITILTGSSPVGYTMPLTFWSPPHMRIDSNFNTKSPSLNCDGATPTPTPTPTGTPTNTPTPTPTNTPTPTATPTPTDEPTPTPTNTPTPTPECDGQTCIHIDCDGGGTCEVGRPTPTPTVTDSPTTTPTPTNTPENKSDGQSDGKSDGKSTSSTPTQSVLGATTMASTGGLVELLSNALFGLGLTFSTLAGAKYAQKKK